MLLGELLQELSTTELKNLAIGGSGSGKIPDKDRATVISGINTALKMLSIRFPLKSAQAIIELHEHIGTYRLRKEYASLNTDSAIPEKYRYIAETPAERFNGNVARIEKVYDSFGYLQDLNMTNAGLGLKLIEFDSIQVPMPKTGQILNVTYRCTVDPIPLDAKDNYEIIVPIYINEALRCYVAHTIYMGMGGERHIAKGQEFLTKYNGLCDMMESANLTNDGENGYNQHFCQGGFV